MAVKSIKIAGKNVSYQDPVFIIAEAGVNHNGDLKTALKLVDAAAESGADCVKFQTFKAEDVTTKQAPLARYQKNNLGKGTRQLSVIKKLELTAGDHKKIISRCREKNIIFMSTPHGGFASVDLLRKLGVPAFKIASGDITNLPLLAYVARLKKPIILGAGMATMPEIKEAIQYIKKNGNNKIVVLHCTTDYPCAPENANLRALKGLMEELGVLVGYSDHTLGAQTAIMAATLGACVIEKHFTLNKKMPGLDHKASLEPGELKDLIASVRKVEIIMGNKTKKPTDVEKQYMPLVRKSLVAKTDIKKGEIFSAENIAIKRPGTGLKPSFYDKILGRKSKRDIKADSLLEDRDL